MNTSTANVRSDPATPPPPGPAESRPFPPSVAPPATHHSAGVPPPSSAYQGVSWLALIIGTTVFAVAAWYSEGLTPSDRFFLFSAALFGLFAAVAASKAVRDRSEGIPISTLFYGLSWVAAITPVLLVAYYFAFYTAIPEASRWNLFTAYCLSFFAAVSISKNTRDLEASRRS
jgi:uncharacterized membrane protein YiaA